MTGLNIESFLRLLRADPGAWIGVGLLAAILALMIWTSWGSRRALWKCLVLSIVAHAGLLAYGGFLALLLALLHLDRPNPGANRPESEAERIRIAAVPDRPPTGPGAANGAAGRAAEPWDRVRTPVELAESAARPSRTVATPESARPVEPPPPAEPLAAEAVVAEARLPEPARPEPIPAPAVRNDPPDAAPVLPVEEAPAVAGPDPAPAESAPATEPARVASENLRARVARPGSAPTRTGPMAALPARAPIDDPLPGSASPPGPAPAAPVRTRPGPIASAAPASPPPSGVELPSAPAVDEAPASNPPRAPIASAAPASTLPESDVRRAIRPGREPATPAPIAVPDRLREPGAPVNLARVTPSNTATGASLPPRPLTRRSLSEIPSVYRSRLDPNRAALAQKAGASPASEQAVERALDWLSRHQDADGRWDAATGRYRDGSTRADDDSYLSHCPPGDLCLGECYYWEADTALTGLSLLAYLGAGYTHVDGKYATTVGRGLDFLLSTQKPDGDLRGSSLKVGMYCHAMATLALAEGYALTGDARLRDAAERGIGFLIRSRARDGLSWRYEPGEPTGDTSILGWVVMATRTGKVSGIAVPAPVLEGMRGWLEKVSAGRSGGLARYQPRDQPSPSMTAEAWACRQFLGFGGPGAPSDEAAAFLLQHAPDRDAYDIYYWYYGTLAMFQRGGAEWTAWNKAVRDQLVRRQETKGHRVGSWEPDATKYGPPGGRIYATALATLTLEVYYRYLRLSEAGPTTARPEPAPRPVDPAARRAGSGR